MIRFGTLREIALPDALTPREWDALARLAVVVESGGWEQLEIANAHEAYLDPKHKHMRGTTGMASCKVDYIGHQLRVRVFQALEKEGLNPVEFVVIVSPCYEPQKPAHSHDNDVPSRWTVELRLNRKYSTARQGAIDTHAPTLSEQHGKARE